jgi:hypothetical protein
MIAGRFPALCAGRFPALCAGRFPALCAGRFPGADEGQISIGKIGKWIAITTGILGWNVAGELRR